MTAVDPSGEMVTGSDLKGILLPDLLRAWRAEAGSRSGRGKPLSQKEIARRAGVSERWYRNLEGGQPVSLAGDVLERLGSALTLGPDERMVLYTRAYGGATPPEPNIEGSDADALRALAHLVEAAEKFPHYLIDHTWDVIAHNPAMAAWFPWVREPSANLLRWALTSPEARTQLVDWRRNAEVYLGQLRFALAGRPKDAALRGLLDELLAVPECLEIWDEGPRVVAHQQRHRFRLELPRIRPEPFAVTSQVLLPAYLPGIRYVVLVPSEDGADDATEEFKGVPST
ncbi:helix-turn-helix transcriptional regulator [Streptomyces sp. UNOC14_S4]|uniref:helix-turn-helix transcriptional regulator n=1 Tax=Streptomyces sp. UNOC14_S4 TaxID=2872340 RepID=UPI001E4C8FFA|nr:helix-turn-helix transcriptional regulator [Streptomyces sp. UNOC14_S4]MCC3768882.1 helix-turn-helix transcriptional regulator [Streptomyces sp. UNOC14_S4]